MSLPLGKKLLAVGMLSLSLNQVYAEGIQSSLSQNEIATSDMQILFEQDLGQQQIAQLSSEEMAETNGAFLRDIIAFFGTPRPPLLWNPWDIPRRYRIYRPYPMEPIHEDIVMFYNPRRLR